MSDERSEWQQLPSDPNPNCDLGYRLLDLETFECRDDRLVMIPPEEDMEGTDAFLIAATADVCNLDDWR